MIMAGGAAGKVILEGAVAVLARRFHPVCAQCRLAIGFVLL
jgi:hypothetical protein